MSLGLLLIFPVIWTIASRLIWPNQISWKEMGVQLFICSLLVWGTYTLGKVGKTWDREVHNGQITQKNRVHGTYEQPYECNCYYTTDSKGNSTRHCSTCYETHYTVKWYLNSTIGTIGIDSADRTSRSVYNLPNPPAYERAYVGEPCSGEFGYTNYVQAVPSSLYGMTSKMSQANYPIPAYPRVHSFYQINRVINVGSKVDSSTLKQLNIRLNEINKTLGPSKQANLVLIITNINNPMYRYAVENAWLGGEKNDIVIFIGTEDGKHIAWVDVMTWAFNKGNGQFKSTLHDDLMSVGVIDPIQLTPVIDSNTKKLYTRPQMKEFEYLEKEIVPPTWVLILALILGIIGSLGCTYFFYQEDPFDSRF